MVSAVLLGVPELAFVSPPLPSAFPILYCFPLLSLALSPSLPPLMSTAYFRGGEGKVLTFSLSLPTSLPLSLCLFLHLCLCVFLWVSVSPSLSLHVSLPLSLPAWLSSPMFPPPPAPV